MKRYQVSPDGGKTWVSVKPMDMADACISSEPPLEVAYSDAPRVVDASDKSPFVPGMFELARRWRVHMNWRQTCIGGEGADYTLKALVDGEWTVMLRGSLASLDRQLAEMERKP